MVHLVDMSCATLKSPEIERLRHTPHLHSIPTSELIPSTPTSKTLSSTYRGLGPLTLFLMLWTISVRDTASTSRFLSNRLTSRRTEAREQDVYGCKCSIGRIWHSWFPRSGPTDPQGLYSPLPLMKTLDNGCRTGRSVLIVFPSRPQRLSQSVPFARRLHSQFIALFGPKAISYRMFSTHCQPSRITDLEQTVIWGRRRRLGRS